MIEERPKEANNRSEIGHFERDTIIGRGTNENTNGLLRRFFPKGTDFKTLTKKEVNKAVWTINNRPRKCLGFKSLIFPLRP